MNNQSNDLTKKIQELEAQVNELMDVIKAFVEVLSQYEKPIDLMAIDSEANKSLDEGIAKLARRRLYSGLGD